MRRYKQGTAVLGLLGVLCALAAFSIAPPASSAPGNNTVQVTKLVNGTPTQNANFEVAVTCGASVQTLTFPPAGGTQSAVFASTVTDGVVCSLVETQTRGATSTRVQAVSATAAITVPNGNDATVPVSIDFDDGDGGQTVNATVTNTFAPGAGANTVRVTKTLTGQVPAGAFFQVDVTCGADTVSLAFTASGGTQDASFPPSGCTPVVTEPPTPPTPAPIATTLTPAVLVPFSPAGGQVQTVTVTNRYPSPGPENTITVTKRLRGDVPQNAQFTVVVDCIPSPADAALPAFVPQQHVFLAAGGTHSFLVSKEYQECTVTETPIPPGTVSIDSQATAVAPAVVVSSGLLGGRQSTVRFASGGDQSAQVTITNRYPGSPDILSVTKATTGTVPPGTLFISRVDCPGVDLDNATPGVNSTRFLAFGDGYPETQEVRVPQDGATCTVRETVSGGSVSRTYAGSSVTQPNSVVAVVQDPNGFVTVTFPNPGNANGDEAQVTITNHFGTTPLADNVLRVKKQLRGDVPDGASFVIRVRCSGGGITDTYNLTFTTNSFQEVHVPANRADCRVIELDDGGANLVVYSASSATADATYGPTSARVDFGIEGGQRGKAIVSNRFPGTCPRPGPKYC